MDIYVTVKAAFSIVFNTVNFDKVLTPIYKLYVSLEKLTI